MLIILFFIATAVSALGTLAGFGGGIFMIPIMVIGLKIPIEIAISSVAISLFPSSLYSTIWNFKRKTIDFRLMWGLEIPTIFGAILGAYLTKLLPTKPLEIIFSIFLLLLAFKMIRPSDASSLFAKALSHLNSIKPLIVNKEYKVGLFASLVFGLLAGTIAGLFGIGGGILKTPIMINVFKVPVKIATSTALCMIVFTSFSSGFTHYRLGHVETNILLICMSGFFTGALIGQKVGFKIQDASLKKLIALSIFLAGASTLIHTLFLK
ncbi:MAG: sulfite exporter TauE/SafE family protein [Oligoflexia bacterium]|nr:sulfite exporter TauE/SafE family protein [Oligoflexia bacterium]